MLCSTLKTPNCDPAIKIEGIKIAKGEKLYQRTKNSDLQIIAVSIDKEPEKARAYMRDKKYNFPVSFDAALMEQSVGKGRGLPRTIMVDKTGRIAVHENGAMLEEDVLALQKFAAAKP